MREPFRLGQELIRPGTSEVVDLPISMMSDHTPATLSVMVFHGRRPGPTVFVSAAVHGDEINGVEVIRRLARSSRLNSLAGTLLLVPIVNSFGFIGHSRYLPDRRDLNRSFPGGARGSLAARLAHLFMSEVVGRCSLGIDLHTAAVHRTNLPQIRIDRRSPGAEDFARAFAPPIIINSPLREGSLRHAAGEQGVPVLVFEAGEGLRFDELSIRIGLRGVLNVLEHLKMVRPASKRPKAVPAPSLSEKTGWVRAQEGGVLSLKVQSGGVVEKGEVIGNISDPFGSRDEPVISNRSGLVIGHATLPIVNQGDALVHIAEVRRPQSATDALEKIAGEVEADPMYDEDEIL